jgi:hypothetical protein
MHTVALKKKVNSFVNHKFGYDSNNVKLAWRKPIYYMSEV